MLSGDVQLKPGPSKRHSCKKSLRSNALILTCNDCNKSTHIKCARISRQEFNNTYRNQNVPWHCSNCSAPCGICHGDVLNDHKAIQCDHCLNWIHSQCCAIDDNEYKRLINSSCSWACPECNNFNFTNSFFRDTEIPTANPFYPLDSNCHNLNETTNNNTTNSKKAYRPKKRPNFRCILINCQSVKKKASDIEALNNLHNPDIICGTESWLDPSIKNGEIFPSNFNVFRKDRETDTTGGGVFQISKDDLITSHLPDLDTNSESIWTETQITGMKPIIMCTLYRPPNDSHGTQIEELDLALSKLGNKINTHNVIITGDFNLPNINWEIHQVTTNNGYSTAAANKLLSLTEEHGLIQHVKEPTHRQGNANNILDLVFTNRPGLIKKINVVDGIADHSTVIIDVNISPKRKHRPKRKVFIRNKADNINIQKSLENFTHEYFSQNQNMTVNDKWNLVSTKIINIMNQYVPHRLTTSRHNLPWFNKDLKKLCKRKKQLYNKAKRTRNPEDWTEFCDIRRNMHKHLRSARLSYISQFLTTTITEKPKSFWSFISKLRQDNQGIGDLNIAGNIISDDKHKAEALNNQFQSVFTHEGNSTLPDMARSPHGEIPKLTITLKGVLDQLSKINISKSQGPDGIPPWFLNRYASHLAPVIHDIFQSSVDSGQVPNTWKEANVTAIFKKGSRAETSNYRPISLTPVVSKLLEHIIHSHIMKHLEQHHILTDHQHGFRAKRSTETQLIQTIHDISKSLDEKKSVDMAILDFTKAFDKVPHKRLIHKLKHYGITGPISSWINSFLTGRTQQVVINGSKSTSTQVISGVPQGTVLGPLLFLLYINDLPDNLSSTVRLFADDCLLYSPIKTDQDTSVLQNDLLKLEKWQHTWLMKFNPTKCYTMTIASRKPTPNLYTFCGQQLKSVESHCYLGIHISNTLNWTIQSNSVTKKAQQTLGMIRRNLNKCPTQIKSIAYTTLVRPILEYASASWDPHCLRNIKLIERTQRQAARFCKNNYSREPGTVTQLLKDLQWDTLQSRRKTQRLSILYKMEHNLIDIPLDQYIKRNTRCSRKHNKQLVQIRHSTNIFGNSFFPVTIKEWNSLPPNIVSSTSLNSFQISLAQHVKN